MVLIALALTATLQLPASPSVPPAGFDCSGPEYRQFDFWVGEWDVVPNPKTTPPPTSPTPPREPALNVVTKTQGGCVILETWDDRHGGTGQSFNIYDRVTTEWHQIWVSNTGGLHFYRGGLRDGRMVYLGEVPLGPAMRVQGRRTVRLSFEPLGPDTVRQFSETLNADGTWSVNYDLIYTRRRRPGSGPNAQGR
ncbi:MAG: hypothetical protein R2745_10825 [Vicinamibacterales bacterium]